MIDNRIFVDTGPYLAAFHERDQRYQKAVEVWNEVKRQKLVTITTNHILDELATLLARRTSYSFSFMKIRSVLESSVLIERPDRTDEEEALKFFEKYADQQISFTDCLSFAVMQRLQLKQCFTFDRHFLDVGHEVFPSIY